jgi:polyhydroxyalkanoate synthesis regulator phasin
MSLMVRGMELPPTKWINKIAKQGKVAPNFVSDCLRKVQTVVTPGLDDVENRLRSHVAEQSTFRSRQFHEVKAAADALRERVAEACSLKNAECFPEYMALCSPSATAAKQDHAIAMKRLRRADVEAALKKGASPSNPPRTAQPIPVSDLPKSMRVMELKLTAGEYLGEVSHLKDLKYSAEYLLQEWLHKYGPAEADKRYQHLRALVQEACNSSAVVSRKSGTLYGEEMLAGLAANFEPEPSSNRNRSWA